MDGQWAVEVMRRAPYITVSFIDAEGKAYGLPLSLASDDDVHWYFHCALEGKKLDAIKRTHRRCASLPCRAAHLRWVRLMATLRFNTSRQ